MSSIKQIRRWVYFFKPPASMPYKKRYTDASYDIHAHESFVLEPNEFKTVITNVAIEIKPKQYGLLIIRLAYATKGLALTGGIIDSSYTGPITAILKNYSDKPIIINKHDRYLQVLISANTAKIYPLHEISEQEHRQITMKSLRGLHTSYHDQSN